MADTLPGHQQFLQLLQQPFEVSGDRHRQTMHLARVTDVKQSGGFAAFSIFLRGDTAQPLPQDTYRVSNDQLGDMLILLVPVGTDGETIEYQAAFSFATV